MLTPYLFILSAIVYILIEIYTIKKEKTIRLLSTFRLMYSFIFGILPAMILFHVETGEAGVLSYYRAESIGPKAFVIWIISVVEYIIISISYKKAKGEKISSSNSTFSGYSVRYIKISILFALIVGFVSLYLWTRAYGSIFNMMVQANLVRSNSSDVYNPWAFLEHFSRIFTFTYFVSFALFLHEKEKKQRLLIPFLLMLIALGGALIVMMCTDTRGEIGILAIVTILYYVVFYKLKDGRNIIRRLVLTGVFFLVAFILIIKSADVMDTIRGLETEESEFEITQTLEREFGFTFTSELIALDYTFDNPVQFLFVDDIINGLFAWIPSRFIPFELPTTLWDFNTQQLHRIRGVHGQAPADFITASLYLFGYLGVFILPLMLGSVLKKLEIFFRNRKESIFHSALYGYMFFFSIWWVAFFSFSSTVLSLFGSVLFWLILRSVRAICRK